VHNISLDPDVLDRIATWRSVRHIFEDVEPTRTAHLVIDMQCAFTTPGAELEVPQSREIISHVNEIAHAVRDTGGLNIFTQATKDDRTPTDWSVARFFSDARRREASAELLRYGSTGHGLDPALEVREADLVMTKTRYSAFFPGSSEVETSLARRGVETLIITGTVTNCCCESTARDAMQMNYQVIFISDATAALSDNDQNATLNNMASIFADVMTTIEVVDLLHRRADDKTAAR
jgi:ureidoacrylate peracid hydrolase